MYSRRKHGLIAAVAVAAGALSIPAGAQAPSAAAPPTPNPMSAAPVQQTPIPAASTPAAPLQTPSTAQNPTATAPLQTPSGSTRMQNPNLASSPIQMPSVIPSRAETAVSAFDKLATSGSTFVTKEEAGRVEGFDRAFSEADRDKDGKLTKDEFNVAWAIYTGRT
jgi:hypothetical protein